MMSSNPFATIVMERINTLKKTMTNPMNFMKILRKQKKHYTPISTGQVIDTASPPNHVQTITSPTKTLAPKLTLLTSTANPPDVVSVILSTTG